MRLISTRQTRRPTENTNLTLRAGKSPAYSNPFLHSLTGEESGPGLQEFFDPQNTRTEAVLEALTALQQIDLRPAMPDISGSLIALRERLQAGAAEQ